MQFRLFVEPKGSGFRTLLLLEFLYEEEIDWYEVRVLSGEDVIGYVHGYANRGWAPQVNNIWVAEKHRRQGIGTIMMSKIGEYFGQIPLPATPIEDNPAARGFWRNFMKDSRAQGKEGKDGK